MAYQRVQKFSSWNSQLPKKTSQFGHRPFPVQTQESDNPPTPQDLEDAAFEHHKFEATGLGVKEEYGTITPEEKEKLSVLRAKMNDFWVQRMEKTKGQPNLLEILMKNSGGIPTTESPKPIQAKLTIGESGDKYEQEADQETDQAVNQINTPQPQQSVGGQAVQQKSSSRSFRKDGIAASADLEASIQQVKVDGQPRLTDRESTIQRWPTGNFYIDSFIITVITIILGWIVTQGSLSSSKSPLPIANSTTNEPITEGEKRKHAKEIAPKVSKELDQNKSLKADVETAAKIGDTKKIVQDEKINAFVTNAAKENTILNESKKEPLEKSQIKTIVIKEFIAKGKEDIEKYMQRLKRIYKNLTEEEETAIRELAEKTYFTNSNDEGVKKEGVKKEKSEKDVAKVEPPEGYKKITRYGFSAYLNDGGFELSEVALTHLVEGANTEDKKNWHRTTKIKGASPDDYYLHPSKKDPALYLLALGGKHTDGLEKARIAKIGHVSSGMHIF